MPVIIFLFMNFICLYAFDDIDYSLNEANKLLKNNQTRKAIILYKELDKNNIIEASYNLGMIYGYGINEVEKKQKLAIKYLKKASFKNHKKAPYYLALLLTQMQDANETNIKLMILKSAVAGFDKAQLEFGKLLLDENKTTYAKEWINKARRQGNMEAEILWHECIEGKGMIDP